MHSSGKCANTHTHTHIYAYTHTRTRTLAARQLQAKSLAYQIWCDGITWQHNILSYYAHMFVCTNDTNACFSMLTACLLLSHRITIFYTYAYNVWRGICVRSFNFVRVRLRMHPAVTFSYVCRVPHAIVIILLRVDLGQPPKGTRSERYKRYERNLCVCVCVCACVCFSPLVYHETPENFVLVFFRATKKWFIMIHIADVSIMRFFSLSPTSIIHVNSGLWQAR